MKANKSKKIVILLLSGITSIVGIFAYVLYIDDIHSNGRLYASKQRLCEQIALSYLKTIKEVEPGLKTEDKQLDPKKWQMAVDIETELTNLCNLTLEQDSLKNYRVRTLEKYQQSQ